MNSSFTLTSSKIAKMTMCKKHQYIPIGLLMIAKPFCTPATMIKSEDVDLQEYTKVNEGEISNN